MLKRYFEQKVIQVFKTSPHLKDETLKQLVQHHQSYEALFDDLLGQHNIPHYEDSKKLVVGNKVIDKFKSQRDNDEWMAKEMLYKLRQIL